MAQHTRYTGYRKWDELEEYWTDTETATGETKPNVPSDSNYVAPVYDPVACNDE